MADKKSFIVYYGIKETLDAMTAEQAGLLFKAMVDYEVEGIEPDFDGALQFAWIPIRQTLTRDGSKYEEIIEKRRAAGKKGGIASGKSRRSKSVANTGKTKQNEAKRKNEADNVNVNVNVNDNDNDNVNESVNDNEQPPDGQTDDVLTLGVNDNVHITREDLQELRIRYQRVNDLIDKVSLWLVKAAHPDQDHMQLIHKFALNDNWPKRPQPEKGLDPEPKIEAIPMPDEIRRKRLQLMERMEV